MSVQRWLTMCVFFFRELFRSGVAEVQLVYITATNSNVAVLASGFFKLAYGGASTAFLSVGISDLELTNVLMNLQTTGTVTVSHSPTSPSSILTPRPVLLVPAPMHAPLFARIVCVWLEPCPLLQVHTTTATSQLRARTHTICRESTHCTPCD